mgnify:CR=1 FL=1
MRLITTSTILLFAKSTVSFTATVHSAERTSAGETDTNWYKLIKQECCPSCREKIIREQTAIRQKNFRKRNREEKRLVKQQNTLLKQENKLLREAVMALRDDVERLKAHQERAC